MSNLKVHVLRLTPGQEVRTCLEEFVKSSAPNGVFVMTCCGSLNSATLRLASDPDGSTNQIRKYAQFFEVLSLSGTISSGGTHLHIALSDNKGQVIGGHVMGDLIVQTTMEVALGEASSLVLSREHDDATGYPELVVKTIE